MENPEEILHCLEEFSKLRPKDIPRELEEYLCFVAKTGDPVYQWSAIKSLFREKLINVITEFYESCRNMDIPPCPNVEMFNYESMKGFILEKLDTFSAAPFTVQRICELLTTPRKEYNRIDKYMRALEKNILVVSTVEPRDRRANHENADGVVNGLEPEHTNDTHPLNEEMDDMYAWTKMPHPEASYQLVVEPQTSNSNHEQPSASFTNEAQPSEQQPTCSSIPEASAVSCTTTEQQPYVSIEPVASDSCSRQENSTETENGSVTITAIPAGVQKRRSSIEPVISSDANNVVQASTSTKTESVAEEPKELPTPSVRLNELADSSNLDVEEEVSQEPVTTEEETKETAPEKIVEATQPEESECESSTGVTEEVSSTESVVVATPAAEEKEVEPSVISSSSVDEAVTNEASTTSEDKIVIEKQDEEKAAENIDVETEKVAEADTPNVEISESANESTPMEVDEKTETPETTETETETS